MKLHIVLVLLNSIYVYSETNLYEVKYKEKVVKNELSFQNKKKSFSELPHSFSEMNQLQLEIKYTKNIHTSIFEDINYEYIIRNDLLTKKLNFQSKNCLGDYTQDYCREIHSIKHHPGYILDNPSLMATQILIIELQTIKIIKNQKKYEYLVEFYKNQSEEYKENLIYSIILIIIIFKVYLIIFK